MSSYVIGDVHGCFDELLELLELISFNSSKDKLIFCGDLINRGPKSLEVLIFIKSLGKSAECVLGNHELYLLALVEGKVVGGGYTLNEILNYHDQCSLINWLRNKPFLYIHKKKHIITHAGIFPWWSIKKAKEKSKNLRKLMKNDTLYLTFLEHFFKKEKLVTVPKYISNYVNSAKYFTCMRTCCCKTRELNMEYKESLDNIPPGFSAWFNVLNKDIIDYEIIFGHWSSLRGKTFKNNIIALDTGCVRGGALSAYCIETKKIFFIKCPKY